MLRILQSWTTKSKQLQNVTTIRRRTIKVICEAIGKKKYSQILLITAT